MELHVRTFRDRDADRRVGRREKIAHWGRGARVAAGVLAALASVWPLTLLAFSTWTSAPHGVHAFLSTALIAWFVFHTMLVFLFGSFAMENPRIYGLRTIWVVGMIFLPIVPIPAYWWLHVWNAPFVNDVQEEDELTGSPKGLRTPRGGALAGPPPA